MRVGALLGANQARGTGMTWRGGSVPRPKRGRDADHKGRLALFALVMKHNCLWSPRVFNPETKSLDRSSHLLCSLKTIVTCCHGEIQTLFRYPPNQCEVGELGEVTPLVVGAQGFQATEFGPRHITHNVQVIELSIACLAIV